MSIKEPVNILLVDDQPAKLLSLRTILASLGENVLEAPSAEDALKVLLSHDVAVVLVDVCMPKMDGFELADLIREHPRFSRTAIIFISAVHLSDSDRVKGFGLGAVDYIPVPIVPDVLRAKVAIFTDLHRKTRELERLNAQLESRADEARVRLAAIVESSQDAIISKTLDGIITSWNSGAASIFGYSSGEMIGKPITVLIPEDLRESEERILLELRAGARIEPFETVRLTKDGRRIDVSIAISPLCDAKGRVVGASKVARDITQRKAAEAVLARDRDTLERLVAERTEQLHATNERLRLADRMATIGTLSAGLGHDIANLLLPVRMRLDAIQLLDLPRDVSRDMEAIRTATDYLQRLASSLRLLALDPEKEVASEDGLDLGAWWADTKAMIRNSLVPPTQLESAIPETLPRVDIGRAGLTQVVFNLVQNAGDALRDRKDGRVTVQAELGADDQVLLRVSDNGIGMVEEVQQRCLEPFFTTKTRGLGTGLGLALVSGILQRAGATLSIDSTPGRGSVFTITLRSVHSASRRGAARSAGVAVVTLDDSRFGAHVRSVLTSMGFDIRSRSCLDEADVWVTEGRDSLLAAEFASAQPTRKALIIGRHDAPYEAASVVTLEATMRPSELRARIRDALSEVSLSERGQP